ncbi:hypothetical protein D3C77_317060 [compost metagenome]
MDRDRVGLDFPLAQAVLAAVGELHHRVTAQQVGKVAVGLGPMFYLLRGQPEGVSKAVFLRHLRAGHGSAGQTHAVLRKPLLDLDQVTAIDYFIGQTSARQQQLQTGHRAEITLQWLRL